MIPAIRPPEISSTCRAHGSPPARWARLVLGERGRAVRRDRDQARALAADAGAEAPGRDVVRASAATARRAASTASRLRAAATVSDVHVVALERVDVAGQQRALLGVERPARRRSRQVGWLERRTGPLQRAVDRRDRSCRATRRPRPPSSAAPRAGSARPAGSAAGAAARRRTRGGSSRAPRRPRPGSPLGRQHAAVGDRHDPRVLGQRTAELARRPSRARQVHRAGAPLPARSACRGRRWWRCGTATTAAPSGPRTRRSLARPAASSPARRPRPRTPTPACGRHTP